MTPRFIALVIVGFASLGPACSRSEASSSAQDAAPTSQVPSASDAGAPRDALDGGGNEAGVAQIEKVTGPEAPFGAPRMTPNVSCAAVSGRQVSRHDVVASFVDGNDLLALVNRAPTGQLPPDYAPTDLVDLRTGKSLSAKQCEKVQCLRREAATALTALLHRMKKEGFPGRVESAFRSYGNQCGTFGYWSRKSSFCEATEQSALPGHSQHQLGTTVDLFTEAWARDPRGVFRSGFGCTAAGKFLREHLTDYGFVMPYPIHADDRHPRQSCVSRWDIPNGINPLTGYRNEHWHVRYVGKEAAARFKQAHLASGIDTPSEITVEQWLRAEKDIANGDAELPVCDGCNCGACSTLAPVGESSCDARGGALHLDEKGRPLVVPARPTLEGVSEGKAEKKKWSGRLVEVKLDVPVGTLTQTPVIGVDVLGFASGATFEKLSPYPQTKARAYAPLSVAWVVAVEPVPNDTGVDWPYRAAIADAAHGRIYNRVNVLLPTRGGSTLVRIPIPEDVHRAKVTLLRGGVGQGDVRTIAFD